MTVGKVGLPKVALPKVGEVLHEECILSTYDLAHVHLKKYHYYCKTDGSCLFRFLISLLSLREAVR